MRRLLAWMPLGAVAVGVAVGGYFVGRTVEKLGPIDSASIPLRALLLEGVLALVAASLGTLSRRDLSWGSAAMTAVVVTIALDLGTSSAFNTIAGSRDCPGTQDCDTLLVPVLMPLLVVTIAGAAAGAFVTEALLRVPTRSA